MTTAVLVALLALAYPAFAQPDVEGRLDPVLRQRAREVSGRSRVIVQFRGTPDVRAITDRGGEAGKHLRILSAHVAEIANRDLASLASDPRVARVSIDRPAFATLERTGAVIGATLARQELGLTGAGIGVAVIDSGVANWHNDLSFYGASTGDAPMPRVVHFRNFVSSSLLDPGGAGVHQPFDDYGHGTHVAGIIAGNGHDSDGARTGVAPRANIVGLKVLDMNGHGYISNVIAAIDYAVSLRHTFNIRVINLSAGAGVYESYETDPLAQAARRAVDAGMVVVTAAGNLGRNSVGQSQYGGVTSPANAPWVLTVGASSHEGTVARRDDTIATFSSRGPTWIDFGAKPDLVAPGVGIESLAEPTSVLYDRYAAYRLSGTNPLLLYSPYLSLSGTSTAAPVVAGTVALMLEANPNLTPNAVKAILQYTAQVYSDVDFLTQGAGYLNSHGAIRMARFFANPGAGIGKMWDTLDGEKITWSQQITWGNHRIGGGVPLPGSNAWALDTRWGAATTANGRDVVLGAASLDNIVWSLSADANIVWGYLAGDNIVWSLDADNIVWSLDVDNIVWSLNDLNNTVWSTAHVQNVVWGEDCGGADCQSVVWGMRGDDGRIWGTAKDGDNIVWGLTLDNIVWSLLIDENIENIVWTR